LSKALNKNGMPALGPRRSVLFVPGSGGKMLEKARTLACDVVVLDLEDSVAPQAKQAARDQVCAAIGTFGAREVVVRINPVDSDCGRADLAAMHEAGPHAVLLPKVEGPADIAAATGPVALWAMIETPRAVLHVEEIAGSGVGCLVMGTNDLLMAMRALPLADRRNLWATLSQTVMAARTHGIAVLDGVYNAIADDEGFAESCVQARAFGFDGKSLIHPRQIEVCNRVFAPTPQEIAKARRIVEAFSDNPSKGAIALEGEMVERLHAEQARRLLALAEAIEGRA
jgi:citrate lyase subunit beta / citryl-CoA lyase